MNSQKLIFITPSYINNLEREQFAKKSLTSLMENTDSEYELIVVDDIPKSKIPVLGKILKSRFYDSASKIYNGDNITLIRQSSSGSVPALKEALTIAEEKGATHIYIHLDDNIYLPILKNLIKFSLDAFSKNPKLAKARLSARPLLSADCTKELGNLTNIKLEDDKITFNNIELKPIRQEDYTLWWSYFHNDMVDEFWPIALWGGVYRLDFLKKILFNKNASNITHLAGLELFYKDKKNWIKFLKDNDNNKIGYINMQFCGLEMHRNKNWNELINYPNNEVR